MSDQSGLYRKEAVEAQKISTLGTIVLYTPRLARLLTFLIVLITAALIAFIYLGSYTKKATVIGELQPIDGVIQVFPDQKGRIVQFAVDEGQAVIAGQRLIKLSRRVNTDDGEVQKRLLQNIEDRRQTVKTSLSAVELRRDNYLTQWQQRKVQLEKQQTTITDQIFVLKQQESLAAANSARYKKLLKQGYVAPETYESKKIELLDVKRNLEALAQQKESLQGQISNLEDEKLQQLGRLDDAVNNFRLELARIASEQTQTEAEQDIWLTAPEAGVVNSLLYTLGQQVDPSRPALALVPKEATYDAFLYADSAQMGFVTEGQRVWLRYEAYPYQKFGQYGATITEVSRISLPASALGDLFRGTNTSGTFYRIKAKLDNQYINAYGNKLALMAGMRFQADIVQEKRRIYEWMLDPLYSVINKYQKN